MRQRKWIVLTEASRIFETEYDTEAEAKAVAEKFVKDGRFKRVEIWEDRKHDKTPTQTPR